jgi:mannose-6-phosphate isomerase-like protein (cupin superfamily)
VPIKYVFGSDDSGRSDLLQEEDIAQLPSYGPFFAAKDLWVNDRTPADLSGTGDATAGNGMVHEPPDGGAVFRVLDLMPKARMTPAESLAAHAMLASVNVPEREEYAAYKDPTMHKTDTLNYFCLVSGELWALSEGRDVLLKPGDVIIQKGCLHGWRNDGDVPVRLIAVLIDAIPA